MSQALWNEMVAIKERLVVVERTLGIHAQSDPAIAALEARLEKLEQRKKPGPKPRG